MAIVYKFSLVFQFNPDTTLWGSDTPGKTGGFTESYWIQNATTAEQRGKWADQRAALLGADAIILGYRETRYTFEGNKMTPGNTQVGVLNRPGKPDARTNSPDDALRILARTNVTNHNWTFFIRCIPDDAIKSGQAFLNGDFSIDLNKYLSNLTTGIDIGQPVCWVGRDPSTTKARVLSWNVLPNILTVTADLGVQNGTDFIRFNRVYANSGLPLKGSYLVTARVANPDGSISYTLQAGPAGIVARPSGTCRKDAIAMQTMNTNTVRVVGERKVGRPSLAYRGRRTRTR